MQEGVTGFELEENVLKSAIFKEHCVEQCCPADLFAVMKWSVSALSGSRGSRSVAC